MSHDLISHCLCTWGEVLPAGTQGHVEGRPELGVGDKSFLKNVYEKGTVFQLPSLVIVQLNLATNCLWNDYLHLWTRHPRSSPNSSENVSPSSISIPSQPFYLRLGSLGGCCGSDTGLEIRRSGLKISSLLCRPWALLLPKSLLIPPISFARL